ncbi:interleukin-12 receptor subunit beta-2 [Archocentrus centrarchus]|uniref:interleukin-12 receptor subunit beta-2 n=1 Tax=Archocentrus centrarchus TaxID=63155 RepID=UPI0011E9CE06|nr:interleukin-12 receptor subunit beta-2-like [Archocentrus centrarchus]
MLPLWSVFVAVAVLAVQLCTGEKSCVIRSTAESVVQRGSSFEVSCTFNLKCIGYMYSGQGPIKQRHEVLNSTTIYFKVVNITENRTYSCQCEGHKELDPCGLDISVGYLPDRPKNISCIYKIIKKESGVVVCTWNRGRDTNLRNSSALWVKTVSGNHTDGPVPYKLSNKGTELLSVNFTVSRSVQLISVWVQTENPLGSAQSSIINYTLSDIAMPSTPVLSELNCSSRMCVIKVEQSVKTHYLEIQYRAEQQTWTTYEDSVAQRNSSLWSISSLEPYRLYYLRARSKFSTGLWSQWSTNNLTWTKEEAPAKELDVWFAVDSKTMRIYWKAGNMSISRGKIIGYEVSISSPNNITITNVSADARSYSVQCCPSCEVTVRARNSKGLSPPAKVTTHLTEAKPLHKVQVRNDGYNITISWTKPGTAPSPTAYLLEWYPEGNKLEGLRWVRLGKNENHTVISGIKPFECYEGALYAFYNESSFSKTKFKGVAILESAPEAGPFVQENIEEKNNVKITWTELPRSQRGGCITNYTIYLETKGQQKCFSDSVPASERMYMFKGLPPAEYSLWMSASTGRGEGPAGQKTNFFIEQDTQVFHLLACVVASLIVLFLLCLCQNSTVKQRFWELFQCFMLDVVPDPANSKWAKECTQEKGKVNVELDSSYSNVSREEEKVILVDVEELPKHNSDTPTSRKIFSRVTPPTSLSSETEPVIPTTYIKSFSHDSDSSDHTHTSLDTTVDYISSHGPGNFDEEDDEEKVEEFTDMPFIASHNIFIEPLVFGGKLTLDAVKIDCSDFFQNI